MRGLPRGYGGASTQCFPSRRLEMSDFEMFRRFRILRDPVQPHPLTQLDIFQDFDIWARGRSWRKRSPERFPARAVSAAPSGLSPLFAARAVFCSPVGVYLGRGAVRAGTAARQPSHFREWPAPYQFCSSEATSFF